MSGAKLVWLQALLGLVTLVCGTPRAMSADAPQPAVLSIRAVGSDLFLLTNERGGLYRSSDRGETWSNVGGGLPNRPVYFLDVDPSGRLWVGTTTWLSTSADRGDTWTPVKSEGLRKISREGRLMFLCWVDERTVLARTWTEGVFRSDDAGETWREVELDFKRLHVTALAKASDKTFWAATFSGGVFRSHDSGATWERAGEGLPQCAVLCLAIAANGDVWVGTHGAGVYRRGGEGRWRSESEGLAPCEIVQTLAVAGDGQIFAGTHRHGLFKRKTDAKTWRSIGSDTSSLGVTAVLPHSGKVLVGTEAQGVYAVDTSAGSWTSIPMRTVVASLARTGDGRIVAALESGPIVVSSDDRRNWRAMPKVPWRDSAVLLSVGESLFAGTTEGLFTSTDNAATWRAVPLPDGPHDVTYLADAGEGTLLAGLAGEQASFGFLRSTDFGTTWSWPTDTPRGGSPRRESSLKEAEFRGQRAPGQAGDRYFYFLTADTSGRAALGTDRGLYHSVDRGRTWMFHFFAYGAFHAALDRQGVLSVAGMNGLFRKASIDAELMPLEVVGRDTILSSYERVFALPNGRLLAAVPRTDLLTRQDIGTWVPRPLSGFGFGRLRCVLVVDDATILAGGPNGLVISRDGGETWLVSPIRYRVSQGSEP
ncbi:MAG: hypothetical protein K8U03_14190 [Planctomycetia bacterium]|nr:hypothetical protein [Planctomycetia bacterium]